MQVGSLALAMNRKCSMTKPVSILQWNVWYLEDIKNIAAFLKANKADVICLQELTIDFDKQNNIHTPEYIAQELGYNVHYQEITFADKSVKLANAIFSKYELSDTRTVWINQEQGSGSYDDENRAYVEARVNVGGKELTVGTVHMSYTHAFEPSERKLQETDVLVEAVKNNGKNFVLTGDFNAQPDSEVIKRIQKHVKNLGSDYDQKTWTTKPFSYNGFEADTLDWRLDYIFGSSDMVVNSSKVLPTEFSDHLPVIVELNI